MYLFRSKQANETWKVITIVYIFVPRATVKLSQKYQTFSRQFSCNREICRTIYLLQEKWIQSSTWTNNTSVLSQTLRNLHSSWTQGNLTLAAFCRHFSLHFFSIYIFNPLLVLILFIWNWNLILKPYLLLLLVCQS